MKIRLDLMCCEQVIQGKRRKYVEKQALNYSGKYELVKIMQFMSTKVSNNVRFGRLEVIDRMPLYLHRGARIQTQCILNQIP